MWKSVKPLGHFTQKNYKDKCYWYNMEGHWSRSCHTAKHVIEFYQASLKKKGKSAETNFIDHKNIYDDDDADANITYTDIIDFFEHSKGAKW